MAKLIVQCRNCQKDVEFISEIDLSKPGMDKQVGDTLQKGALCEVCDAEYRKNYYDDGCYVYGPVPEPTESRFTEGQPSVPLPKLPVKWVPYKDAVKHGKELLDIPVPYIVDCDNIDFKLRVVRHPSEAEKKAIDDMDAEIIKELLK